jgi:hypothetical protein
MSQRERSMPVYRTVTYVSAACLSTAQLHM